MSHIAAQRLHNQQLIETKLHTPKEVVAWQGAVQAQEYAYAKWALGMRLRSFSDDDVEQAFTNGDILRTHIMRPTWHFVAPEDIRWLLKLTAPRVNQVNAYMYRQLELDDALFTRSNAVITKALEGGQQLTREELGKALAQVGIVAEGMRLGYIVHRAELEAVVCSGPRHGKQFTYMLLEERVPPAKPITREEALVEFTKRFFTSHGPATAHDFSWWSGLTMADVKAGLEMSKPHLVEDNFHGNIYWRASSSSDVPPTEIPSPSVHLLPPYDEYTIAYKDHTVTGILEAAYAEEINRIMPNFIGFYIIDGYIAGMWKRKLSKRSVVIETAPFRSLTAEEENAFAAAAQRFGGFLEMPVTLA